MTEHDCEKHHTRERLDEALKEFLAERIESDDGSYPPVPEEAQRQLEELIHLLIELKWERDCDGDSVIRYKLWNLNRDMIGSYHHFVIPREPEDGDVARWLDLLAANAAMANEALTREARCLKYRRLKIGEDNKLIMVREEDE
jgi:hypothetical protein